MEQPPPQRLAAILVADVAGYTRLMEKDEARTVSAWRRARAEAIDPVIEQYRGRIVKLTGDGFLAEFSTVESAVRTALAMQRALAGLFAAEPADRQFAFRMGVNVGDISMPATKPRLRSQRTAVRLRSRGTAARKRQAIVTSTSPRSEAPRRYG